MSSQLATRIIDGDGHIMEDNLGIIAHLDPLIGKSPNERA